MTFIELSNNELMHIDGGIGWDDLGFAIAMAAGAIIGAAAGSVLGPAGSVAGAKIVGGFVGGAIVGAGYVLIDNNTK
jgi:bacteriocin-like protein